MTCCIVPTSKKDVHVLNNFEYGENRLDNKFEENVRQKVQGRWRRN